MALTCAIEDIGAMIGLGFRMPFALAWPYTVGCLLPIIVERTKSELLQRKSASPSWPD